MTYRLSNLDATAFLKSLKPASVDLIVSSPPYFMGKEYDRSSNVQEFLADHLELLPALIRVLKPGGSLCWQVGNHIADRVLVPLDALIYQAFACPELHLRNRIIWTFGHGAHAKKRFSGRHETVMWYTSGDSYHFDLDAARVPQKYPGKRHYKGPKRGELSGNPLGKNPGDVWEIPNVNARHVEKSDHPCQFPVALVQRLVRALTPYGGLVVDPFMGSGSAGVAALVEGRNFAGTDISSKYVAIARKRIRAASKGHAQFRPVEQPIYVPQLSQAVARLPEHFAAARTRDAA